MHYWNDFHSMNKYLWSIHLLDAKGIIVNEKDMVLVHMKLEGKRTLLKKGLQNNTQGLS